ncbi:uncharacterized protein LOC115226398 [Octopus sinensis]|uniref:Uncharacterized protein LOC115226398 n=1 Tax=Octopus sinensis TaxID=2607531 RepID=A0A6P7TWT4_9MOLL|nr:uncharacterized protein LOC115226398 [Octopus sinensis]
MFQFPPTNPDKATGLLLLLSLFALATIPTATVAIPSQQETIANYRYFGPGYSFAYPGTPSQSEIFPSRSQVECAMNTLKNRTGFFSYDRVNQLCKTYPENIVLTASNLTNSGERSFYIRDHWIKVYSISMGAGSDVYNSFLNIGDRASWKVDDCLGLYCPNFFRNSILDVWEQFPIHEVKLVLYENQQSVVTMVFNGRNTNIQNWFSAQNLRSSPWTDLSTSNTNYFSMDGYENRRRFYVSRSHTFCVGDVGWLMISEQSSLCVWEASLVLPRFLYSSKSTKTDWVLSYGSADTLAIFIRFI